MVSTLPPGSLASLFRADGQNYRWVQRESGEARWAAMCCDSLYPHSAVVRQVVKFISLDTRNLTDIKKEIKRNQGMMKRVTVKIHPTCVFLKQELSGFVCGGFAFVPPLGRGWVGIRGKPATCLSEGEEEKQRVPLSQGPSPLTPTLCLFPTRLTRPNSLTAITATGNCPDWHITFRGA